MPDRRLLAPEPTVIIVCLSSRNRPSLRKDQTQHCPLPEPDTHGLADLGSPLYRPLA